MKTIYKDYLFTKKILVAEKAALEEKAATENAAAIAANAAKSMFFMSASVALHLVETRCPDLRGHENHIACAGL